MYRYEISFADALWKRLKAWAKEQAAGDATPSDTECIEEVKRMSADLVGPTGSLRPEALQFFATETCDMITKYRARRDGGNDS